MRRWIAFILLAGIMLAVAGAACSKNKSTGGKTATPTVAVAKTATAVQASVTTAAAPTATLVPPTQPPRTSAFTTFGSGTKIVGTEIAPGTYRTRRASGGCYWARLNGFGGTTDEIITNENTDGPEVVTIAPTDKGFQSQRCGTWTSDLSSITQSPTSPFGTGTFIVGVDIASGTWRADGGSDCYWARLSEFGGTTDGIIANDNGTTIVTIAASDRAFTNARCGTWTQVSQ